MTQVVIENPILSSPYGEPTRHFKFTEDGITDEIVAGRRKISYFVPIARPKKRGGQHTLFETEWTQDRVEETRLVNDIRERVALWRKGGYPGSWSSSSSTTPPTASTAPSCRRARRAGAEASPAAVGNRRLPCEVLRTGLRPAAGGDTQPAAAGFVCQTPGLQPAVHSGR
jgi:hypothetical protein